MLKLEINIEGATLGDLELAIDEAKKRIMEGNYSGFDSNSTGSFNFSRTGDEEAVDKDGEIIEVGDTVDVDEPEDGDMHNNSFTGTVKEVRNGVYGKIVTVEDQEENTYDLEGHQLLKQE
jgi:hypothetical protein